ncbi:MAG: hypothetical protein U5L96_13935 [Owenweeksia sp.]|nr:hypothetical protein [Owenweeksia sp.]
MVSGYNNAANTFSFSMINQSSGTSFDYQLNIVQMLANFSEGSFSLSPNSGGFGATTYRNITVDPMEVYLATSGTFTVDKLKVIGQASGVSVNYIDGTF